MRSTSQFAALAFLALAATVQAQTLVINEVDADQSGTDAAEFIEIYDGGAGNTDLTGLVLVFFNGSDTQSYTPATDLDGFSTNGSGYFVVCANAGTTANCDLDISPDTNLIQNGADAVALIQGDAANYPNDTAIPADLSVVVDALVYDTNDSDLAGLLVLLNAGQPQINEDGGTDSTTDSNQRCSNGSGGQRNTDTYIQAPPTPGATNDCPVVPVDLIINEVDADQAGTDTAEFIEIYDGGVGNSPLDGHVLVFFNGSDTQSYTPATDLDGFSTNGSGYFVVCANAGTTANCDLDISPDTNLIQNGADAVALILGDAADYPNDTAIPADLSVVVDALVYDTNDSDLAGLLVLLNAGQPQINEDGGTDSTTDSNQRCDNGSGGQRNTDTYTQNPPTPGADNDCPTDPTGACCDFVTLSCTIETAADCALVAGATYNGDDTDCSTCTAPTGGCCDTDFSCTVGTEAACDGNTTASYLGDGSDCSTCQAPTGSCCDECEGSCTEETSADCAAAGNTYGGDGTDCAGASCNAPPTGACCTAGFCQVVAECVCTAIGGGYSGDGTGCAGPAPELPGANDPGKRRRAAGNAVTCPAGPDVVINEIRVDSNISGDDEYFELIGAPGTSLDGLFYVVIGDDSGDGSGDLGKRSGSVEEIVPLSGLSLPADGIFLADEGFLTLVGTPDLTTSFSFENSDNVSHLLVAGFTGAVGDDLDADNDGVLETTPWAGLLDGISLIETDNPPAENFNEWDYGFGGGVGPDGTFVPAHIKRCEDATGAWFIGTFSIDGSESDTPGDPNDCPSICGNGIIEGTEACDDGNSEDGDCCSADCSVLATAGTECRASAGECDIAEVCDGASGNCPADLFDSVTVCRVAADLCDVDDVCDGTSATCPADGVAPAGTDCRESEGQCDLAEVCDGTNTACPADAFSTAECRASAGQCDVAEFCDGASENCPADGFDTGTECRASAGQCDIAESCDGTGADCPADGFDSGTECRASTGDCDPAEACDGTGADCPADLLSTDECRAAAGICDLAEFCNGVDSDCPADAVADNSTVCGPSANECDPEELCDGTGVDCPADVTINDCIDDDGCCLNTVAGTPNGPCNNNNDNDCPIVCGNGALEAGEVCDDGNNVDEDGCSSDCSFLSAPVPASSRWSMTLLVTAMIAALVVVGRRRKTA